MANYSVGTNLVEHVELADEPVGLADKSVELADAAVTGDADAL